MTGTFRTFLPETHDLVDRRLREICTAVGSAMQCETDIEVEAMTPPVVNDAAVTERLRQAFSRINSSNGLRWPANVRWMAAEDVSLFLERVPGTFLFVGSADPARHLDYPHHHPQFDFDEDALPIGAGLLATAVADYVLPE